MPAQNRSISFGEMRNYQKSPKKSLPFFLLKTLLTSDSCIEKYKKVGQKIAAMFHLSQFLGLKALHLNFALITFVGIQVQEKNLKSQRSGVGGEQSKTLSPFCRFYKNAPHRTVTKSLSPVRVTLTLVFTGIHSLDALEIF